MQNLEPNKKREGKEIFLLLCCLKALSSGPNYKNFYTFPWPIFFHIALSIDDPALRIPHELYAYDLITKKIGS